MFVDGLVRHWCCSLIATDVRLHSVVVGASGHYTAGEAGMIANRRTSALARRRLQPPACGIDIHSVLLLALVSSGPSASVLQRWWDLQIHHTTALPFTRKRIHAKTASHRKHAKQKNHACKYRRSLWPKRGRHSFIHGRNCQSVGAIMKCYCIGLW